VHETGHILGLPDLYNYDRVRGDRKSGHKFVGAWDPMGYQGHGSDFLAWHKYKLSWLEDAHFEVRKEGTVTLDLSHIQTSLGLKAVVAPVSGTEAYVAEVKNLNASRDRAGVLIYKVATDVASGKGPIRVMPAVQDDDEKHPELFRNYFAHYQAQYFAGDHFEDAARRVRIDVLSATANGFRVRVSR
jgi:hypothetical protein